MGLFRFLRKWKEKADGTLTGPALETESVNTEVLDTNHHLGIPVDSRNIFSSVGQSIDGFEDIANDWSASHGSITAETSDVYAGTQSARLTASGEMARITYDFGTNQDLSDVGFSLAIKHIDISGSSANTPIRLRLADGDFNWREYRIRCREGTHDRWGRQDFGIESEEAGFDITNVGTIAIQTNSRDDIDILVDDLRKVDESGQVGRVIVTIDDLHDGDVTAAEVFGRYNIPIGLASNLNFLGNSGKLTESEYLDLLEMPHVYGINHGYNHLNWGEDADDDVKDDVIKGKEEMFDLGIREHAYFHIYGAGSHDQDFIDFLADYHVMSFGTGASSYDALTPNRFSSPWYNLRCSADSGTSEATTAIEDAATFNQVAHIYFHSDEVTQSDMETVAQKIDSEDVEPITMMQYYAANNGPM